ncbi:conserved hypothetical protein [Magnetospirillum sp. LM-5]|uniref:hypothetical protein n=1 Tax=Magnetospirillum sp. LM-5 TaxID=2681466 RepID=UPI0013815113|nr:hypothetical protein [Magnetospirillum sp. LM-5]CAA7617203.1 conserved hypothetical protein [Magnetospirillum sp. LM-5]
MTRLYSPGESGRAICDQCGIVSTTYQYRDVPFSDGRGLVKDILVGVCNCCGAVVAIPPQSTPAIKAQREKSEKPIEAVLPAIYVDALDLACYKIDSKSSAEFRKKLVVYYIHTMAGRVDEAAQLAEVIRTAPAQFSPSADKKTKRISFKVTESTDAEMRVVMNASHLNRTDVLKSLVLKINRDIIQPKSPKNLRELKLLAAVS